MRDKDELDILLDAALSTYSDAAVPPYLETRVLASVGMGKAVDGSRPSRRWMLPAIAVPVAAALLLAFFLAGRHHAAPGDLAHLASPASRPSAADIGKSEVTPQEAARATGARVRPVHITGRGTDKPNLFQYAFKESRLPKREVFPTPQPLSPEEQRLIAVIRSSPPRVSQAVTESQQNVSAPLVIAAIHIPPLNPPDKNGN